MAVATRCRTWTWSRPQSCQRAGLIIHQTPANAVHQKSETERGPSAHVWKLRAVRYHRVCATQESSISTPGATWELLALSTPTVHLCSGGTRQKAWGCNSAETSGNSQDVDFAWGVTLIVSVQLSVKYSRESYLKWTGEAVCIQVGYPKSSTGHTTRGCCVDEHYTSTLISGAELCH